MKIGIRRWSVMILATAGVLAIEVIAQYTKTAGLGVASAGALVGMVAGYCGFDAVRKGNPADKRDEQA